MLDYCAELYGITLMLKVDMAYINEVMNVWKSDVKYRL
jgi:hypothetical protein